MHIHAIKIAAILSVAVTPLAISAPVQAQTEAPAKPMANKDWWSADYGNYSRFSLQAALATGATFSVAAAVPVLAAYLASPSAVILAVVIMSTALLAILGALGAKASAAPLLPPVLHVMG